MKATVRQFIYGYLLLGLMAGLALSEVRIQAEADRSRPIYAGSRFTYRIVIENGQAQGVIDLTPLESFNPSGPSTQNSTSIINGRSTNSQTLNYQLLAPAQGEYTIPPIQVKVDGSTYQTNPVTISVVEPGSTNHIDISMEISTQQAYVGQPIIVTISAFVWADIVRAEQIANIDIQVPFINSNDFYIEDIDAKTMRAKQTVLPINNRKDYVFQDQVDHHGVNCVRIRYIKVLIPKKHGIFKMDPASVSADIAVGRKQRSRNAFFDDFFGSQYEYKRFSAQSDPLELTVQALPQAGKPVDFYGLVGDYTITADAAPKNVNVGDPITLNIKIGGGQYLKPVQWPKLGQIPEMDTLFRIPAEYADGEIQDDVKVFTQTIRANSDTVTQVPPIPLSFFDADSGQYRTAYSEPIPLEVSPTRIVTGSDVESRQVPAARKQIEAIREGLSANYTSLDALDNQRFSAFAAITGPTFILLYLLPVLGLTGSIMTRLMTTDSPKRKAATKRKKAYSQAVRSIRNATNHEKPSQQILSALQQYVADKFGKSAGSLTATDCNNIIAQSTQNTDLAMMYQDVMEQTEASQYSPMAFKLTAEKQKEILELLSKIEKTIK